MQSGEYSSPVSTTEWAPPAPPKRSPGCFFWGCFTAAILTLVAAVILAVLLYYGVQKGLAFVEEYAVSEPLEMPTLETLSGEEEGVAERWARLALAFERGEQASIELTTRELNILVQEGLKLIVAENEELKGWQPLLWLDILEDALSLRFSVPLDEFGYSERFFNLSALFDVSKEKGDNLSIYLKELRLKDGTATVPWLERELKKNNLADGLYKDLEGNPWLTKLERVEIDNGVLRITTAP